MKPAKYFIWILPAAAAVTIFVFSSQPAGESSRLSNAIVMKITDFLSCIMPSGDTEELFARLSVLVRKAAHVFEYTVFYLTLMAAWYVWGFRKLKLIGSSMLAVFLYACTDEIHQLFVDGRAGRFTDVLIDCLGAAVISIILIVVIGCRRAEKN